MVSVTFVEHDGTTHKVEAAVGRTLLQIAQDNMVPGLLGDCGGFCSCATCHCYIDGGWMSKLPAADETETEMLGCAVDQAANSRLGCQVKLTEEMNGLTVRLPKSQL